MWRGSASSGLHTASRIPARADRRDCVVLVRCPSRAAFLDMVGSPAYAAANAYREQAVAKHVFLASSETYSTRSSTMRSL
jgi:hypothetical protein